MKIEPYITFTEKHTEHAPILQAFSIHRIVGNHFDILDRFQPVFEEASELNVSPLSADDILSTFSRFSNSAVGQTPLNLRKILTGINMLEAIKGAAVRDSQTDFGNEKQTKVLQEARLQQIEYVDEALALFQDAKALILESNLEVLIVNKKYQNKKDNKELLAF